MTPPVAPGPFWLVGCGNMAGAMLQGWIAAGAAPQQFTVIRPSGTPVGSAVRVVSHLPDGERPAVVLLGVKPQKLAEVAPSLAGLLSPDTLLISILAGVELSTLRDRFPAPRAIVRAMPNLPVALNRGVTGLVGDGLDERQHRFVSELMDSLGLAEWMQGEALMDLVAALAGSGPAFLYRFVDALAGAGRSLGFSEAQAERLAMATVEGAAIMAAAADASPATLADRVASPGGSTRAGLNILDEPEGGIRELLVRTLGAAVTRNREMAEEARRS